VEVGYAAPRRGIVCWCTAQVWGVKFMTSVILNIAQGYALIGCAVAVVFVLWGVGRVAADARGAWTFRPLIVPGVILLWPLVLWRWHVLSRGKEVGGRAHRPPRRAQDLLALALAVAIPLVLATGLVVRQDGPKERPAVQLSKATDDVRKAASQ
jgi:hypothetical protein